jgi:hypothetical protein
LSAAADASGTPVPLVELDPSAEVAGLGPLLADLIGQNLQQHPERRAALAGLRGAVVIRSTDAGVTVILRFAEGRLLILGGVNGRPDLTVETDSLTLLELANARLRFGLPDPTVASGRAVLAKLLRGTLKLRGRGLLLRPGLLPGLTKLLNVATS